MAHFTPSINKPAPPRECGAITAALPGEIVPTTKPDVDNYVKAAMDVVNAIVITDDSLVVELAAAKQYALVPQLTVVIVPLPALTAQGRAS